jgi:aminoglycoside phosphotransferase (APT) family kinase protein
MTDLLEDLRRRTTAAVARWAPGAEVSAVEPLTGGSSSLTYVATLRSAPEQRVVLKVAPPGLPPLRNRDVLRQGRLMAALADVPGVRVPRALFEVPAESLDVPPFLAMNLVPGECLEPVLSPRGALPAETVRARMLDAVRMLADLHRVDPSATALADEPVVTIADEIDRWTRAFTTVPEDLREGYEKVAELLHATVPPALPPAVLHGDYRLGNTLCVDDRVAAIIDWEIWAVGDPRIDVTWLQYFTDEATHPGSPSAEPTGTPTKAEVLAAYEEARGAPLPDLDWFEALTKYKETAATALLIKRERKAGTPGDLTRRMQPALPVMLREATELIEAR